MGGAVNGAQYYGVAPELCNNGPDDIGRSRLLIYNVGRTNGSHISYVVRLQCIGNTANIS